MAFEYGFYNSISGDRKYNAIQFGQIFDGIIEDGVFQAIGDKLFTTASTGMDIVVGTGKAWFNHTWNLNTTKIPFTLEASHPVLSRYDAVILEINESPDPYGRVNCIKVISGTPSSNPEKPALINSDYIHQYPLSYIKINPGVTEITAVDIEIVVGQTPCPFVTGILQVTDITGLYASWEEQFNTWLNNLKAQLTGDIVTNLQNQIDDCLKKEDIATTEDIVNGTAGKVVTADQFRDGAFDNAYNVGDMISTYRKDLSDKWLYCNGESFNKEEYPELAEVLPSPLDRPDLYAQKIYSYGKTKYVTNHTDENMCQYFAESERLIVTNNNCIYDKENNSIIEKSTIASFVDTFKYEEKTYYAYCSLWSSASSSTSPVTISSEDYLINGTPTSQSNTINLPNYYRPVYCMDYGDYLYIVAVQGIDSNKTLAVLQLNKSNMLSGSAKFTVYSISDVTIHRSIVREHDKYIVILSVTNKNIGLGLSNQTNIKIIIFNCDTNTYVVNSLPIYFETWPTDFLSQVFPNATSVGGGKIDGITLDDEGYFSIGCTFSYNGSLIFCTKICTFTQGEAPIFISTPIILVDSMIVKSVIYNPLSVVSSSYKGLVIRFTPMFYDGMLIPLGLFEKIDHYPPSEMNSNYHTYMYWLSPFVLRNEIGREDYNSENYFKILDCPGLSDNIKISNANSMIRYDTDLTLSTCYISNMEQKIYYFIYGTIEGVQYYVMTYIIPFSSVVPIIKTGNTYIKALP